MAEGNRGPEGARVVGEVGRLEAATEITDWGGATDAAMVGWWALGGRVRIGVGGLATAARCEARLDGEL